MLAIPWCSIYPTTIIIMIMIIIIIIIIIIITALMFLGFLGQDPHV